MKIIFEISKPFLIGFGWEKAPWCPGTHDAHFNTFVIGLFLGKILITVGW